MKNKIAKPDVHPWIREAHKFIYSSLTILLSPFLFFGVALLMLSSVQVIPAQQLPSLPTGAVVRSATWPKYPPDRAFVLSLPIATQNAVKKSPLPVLLPPDPSLAGRAFMIIRPTGYTATIDNYYSDIQVSVRGEAISYNLKRLSRSELVRGLPAMLARGEVGWFLSWDEFGVSYQVFLGCASQDSVYCRADQVLRIGNSLVYAGGSGTSQ